MKLVTFLKSHHLILSQNKEDKKVERRGRKSAETKNHQQTIKLYIKRL